MKEEKREEKGKERGKKTKSPLMCETDEVAGDPCTAVLFSFDWQASGANRSGAQQAVQPKWGRAQKVTCHCVVPSRICRETSSLTRARCMGGV